jgi:hypothetical protein
MNRWIASRGGDVRWIRGLRGSGVGRVRESLLRVDGCVDGLALQVPYPSISRRLDKVPSLCVNHGSVLQIFRLTDVYHWWDRSYQGANSSSSMRKDWTDITDETTHRWAETRLVPCPIRKRCESKDVGCGVPRYVEDIVSRSPNLEAEATTILTLFESAPSRRRSRPISIARAQCLSEGNERDG